MCHSKQFRKYRGQTIALGPVPTYSLGCKSLKFHSSDLSVAVTTMPGINDGLVKGIDKRLMNKQINELIIIKWV